MVAVHLYQPLAERFGAVHEFAVHSPREAILALDANFPDFQREFLAIPEYWVVVDGEYRSGEEGAIMPASVDIHLVPKVEGSGPALFVPLLGMAGIYGMAATILSGVLFFGVMIGLSLLFRKKVKTVETEDNKLESYAFSGPENVTQQGVAVPLIYGRTFAGSVVVSAGLELGTDLYPAIPAPPPPPSQGAVGYPTTSKDPLLTAPAAGWPPIILQKVPYKPALSRVTLYKNIYGPQGYAYIGANAVTRYVVENGRYVQKQETVDQWRGGMIQNSGGYNPRRLYYYAWTRIAGFYIYDASTYSNR